MTSDCHGSQLCCVRFSFKSARGRMSCRLAKNIFSLLDIHTESISRSIYHSQRKHLKSTRESRDSNWACIFVHYFPHKLISNWHLREMLKLIWWRWNINIFNGSSESDISSHIQSDDDDEWNCCIIWISTCCELQFYTWRGGDEFCSISSSFYPVDK